MTSEINNIAKETVEILNYFDSSFVSKISVDFLSLLKELARKSSITVTIDKNKKLEEQAISEECKNLIALIYRDYIADEEEKRKIEKIWNENELIYQQKIAEKYNIENIFKKKNQVNDQILSDESMALIKYKKDSFCTKILKRIKSFLRK